MKKILLSVLTIALIWSACQRDPVIPANPKVTPKYSIEHLDAGKTWLIQSLKMAGEEQELSPCQRAARVVFRKTPDEVRRGSMNYPDTCGVSDSFLWDINNDGTGFVLANTAFQNDCKVVALSSERLVISLESNQIVYQIEFSSR
jgi:hypothetical protein